MPETIVHPADGAAHPNGRAAVRAERAAARAGVEAAEVERLPFDLSVLEDEGLFVNVDARGFGLLDRRLDWQALGISLPRGSDLAFRPPRCGLLPDRYRLPLLRPAARAHAALHKYSYRFRLTETMFESPAYRWVPWRAFPAFEQEFNAAREALEVARSEVVEQYDAVREGVVEAFLRLAADSARRLEATGHAIPEGFEDAVVRGVLGTMPGPDDLRHKLALRYRVGVLLLGSEMLAEQRAAREERRRLEASEAELRLDQRRQEARARLVQEELWAEEERIRRRLQAEEEERRREATVKERLRTLKVEAARERLEEVMSPLEEGARQLHAAVYEAASAIRASLQKHGRLHGASAKKARELARWFRLMQWQSDRGLEALLGELEQLAGRRTGTRKRDPGPIEQVLGDIVELCYADARALAEPSRMGALEL
ncbi:MAG: hypothetical protein AB7I38_18370 [Dehalococcoidia bacterium]